MTPCYNAKLCGNARRVTRVTEQFLFVTTMISTTISTQYYTLDISPREIVSFVSLRLLIFPGILFNHCYAGSGDHYSANHYRLQNKGNRKSPTT